MITANEIKQITDQTIIEMKNRAKDCAKHELEYIQETILENAKKGQYSARYWWTIPCIEDMGTDVIMFLDAVTEMLILCGFETRYEYNVLKAIIYIKWEDSND